MKLVRQYQHLKLEAKLNEQQFAAVTAPESRVLVLSGAGTGKTTVITYRVAHLIKHFIDPRNIILLTFTNRAAKMMLSRVEALTGISAPKIIGGTFHHVASLFLRKYARSINLENNFSIIDDDDAKSLVKKLRKTLIPKTSEKDFPSASQIYTIWCLARNKMLQLKGLIREAHFEFTKFIDDIEKMIVEYEALKRKQKLMDFDDLQVNFLRLLKSSEVGKSISKQFQHVLADEYQDTSPIQAEIVKELSYVNGNVYIVGDDTQSIYSFRAADYRNILNVPKDFPGTAIYKLEINYRSTPEILALANSIISNTAPQFLKKLKPTRPSKEVPKLVITKNPKEQAEFIARQILNLKRSNVRFNSIGVLFRSHRHSLKIELALKRNSIPYRVRGGIRFMERAHIKDLLAHLYILANPLNETALTRVVSLCENVGTKTIACILSQLNKQSKPLEWLMSEELSNVTKGKGKNSLKFLSKVLSTLYQMLNSACSIDNLILYVIESYYKERMASLYDDFEDRVEDIDELVQFSKNYEDFSEFLTDSALNQAFSGRETLEFETPVENEDKVTLTTIHQAKGLEWDCVFIANLTDGDIPHRMCFHDPELIEEERRLFYVAVTRAKNFLFLSFPESNEEENNDYPSINRPSRFLRDINEHLYECYTIEWSN